MSILNSAAAPGENRLRDYHTEFIEGSRWLRSEQAAARTAWYKNLPVGNKDQVTFEFEMMLKAVVCFGSPFNHPGPLRRGEPAAMRNFASELRAVKEMVHRIVDRGRRLTVGDERTQVFQRYLESVIAQDPTRFRMVKKTLHQDTPPQSLALLVSNFKNLSEILEGFVASDTVSFGRFSAIIRIARREIHRSTYFDPLPALEFRPEFDRIRSPQILRSLRQVEVDAAQKVLALTFLSMFRMLRYLDYLDAARAGEKRGIILGWLAVLRSDARALCVFLRRDTAFWLSTGFARRFEQLGPEHLREEFGSFTKEFAILKSLRELLASIGDQLGLEQRKLYEQHLPRIEQMGSDESLGDDLGVVVSSFRSFFKNAMVLLVREFDSKLQNEPMLREFVSSRAHLERLRRDIWMFLQVLRAFIEKAKGSASSADRWSGINTFSFVKEFVAYFRSFGYQLLRFSEHRRLDSVIGLLDRLKEGDVLEVQRLERIVVVCQEFHDSLASTFEDVGRRGELAGVPFDRKEAARTLKLFLRG